MIKLGFDIGGSHIAGGAYGENNTLIARASAPFPMGETERLPQIISSLANELCGTETPVSIGIGVPGAIDPKGETVLAAYNLGLFFYPIKAKLEEFFPNVPIFIANDADCAALGEFYGGALKGSRCSMLLTLGTGLGCGIIINGKLWRGGKGHGCELGHFTLGLGGRQCSCGNKGCAEAYCSATGLIMTAKEQNELFPGILGELGDEDLSALSAKHVFDAAKAGDKAATLAIEYYIDALSRVLTSMMNILDPELIAIGGGVSLAGDALFEPLREKAAKHSFYPDSAAIVPAQLGNDAGMFGAAMLCADHED